MGSLNMEKFGNLFFERHESPTTKVNCRPIVLLPGGPSIAGTYLNHLADQLSLKYCGLVFRLVLPNHEIDSDKPSNLKFEDVYALVSNSIDAIQLKYRQKPTLIGHSFGALLTATLLERRPELAAEAILMNSPMALTGWARFSAKMKETGVPSSANIHDEESFRSWWQKVLPLYFAKAPDLAELSLLSNITYFAKSAQQEDAAPVFENIFKALAARKSRNIRIILGDLDIIGPDNSNESIQTLFGELVYIMPNVGHFPMLENELETLKQIDYLIGNSVNQREIL